MPVANCFIRRELISGADSAALTSRWAEESLDSSQVHVITSIVEPGHVVEDGEIQEW